VSPKNRFFRAGDAPARKNWIFACGRLSHPHGKIKIETKKKKIKTLTLTQPPLAPDCPRSAVVIPAVAGDESNA
jgi:hypothetical protein